MNRQIGLYFFKDLNKAEESTTSPIAPNLKIKTFLICDSSICLNMENNPIFYKYFNNLLQSVL